MREPRPGAALAASPQRRACTGRQAQAACAVRRRRRDSAVRRAAGRQCLSPARPTRATTARWSRRTAASWTNSACCPNTRNASGCCAACTAATSMAPNPSKYTPRTAGAGTRCTGAIPMTAATLALLTAVDISERIETLRLAQDAAGETAVHLALDVGRRDGRDAGARTEPAAGGDRELPQRQPAPGRPGRRPGAGRTRAAGRARAGRACQRGDFARARIRARARTAARCARDGRDRRHRAGAAAAGSRTTAAAHRCGAGAVLARGLRRPRDGGTGAAEPGQERDRSDARSAGRRSANCASRAASTWTARSKCASAIAATA